MVKIELTIIQDLVLNMIPRSSERPAKVVDISAAIGMSEREINAVIRSLTMKGIPVCSLRSGENKGVFIPVNEQERSAGLVALQNQATDMKQRIENVQKADLNWHKKLA